MMRSAKILGCISFLFVGCLIPSQGFAQSLIQQNFEIDVPTSDTTIYLGDWVVESTIKVMSKIDQELIQPIKFHPQSGLLYIPMSEQLNRLKNSRLNIEFSYLPISIPRNYSINNRITIPDSNLAEIQSDRIEFQSSSRFDSDLTQSGSLSRGIIVGSNQDFALESGLQFELSGQLTEDIYLDAVLTDQSIPFQPDGTTQSIREFDKVLIRLRSENSTLEMGDVDVSLEQSTFAKLNRRLQGASGSINSESGNINAAISSVRGTFRTQRFDGLEGVQGPYRLRGKNNEEFIIVVAGTERVFINGIQVARGQEFEYIIDYGLGEITFTDNVFIKEETRIYIEYEYIDQDFTRTLVAAEAEDSFFDDRLQFGVSFIRQADGDELLSQQVLSEQDISVLEQVGDNLDLATVSGVITNPRDDEINIKYAQVDTTLNGVSYRIFKNIPGSNASNLVVRFSNVGLANGSYRRIGDAINGILYEWVGPGNGSYEPFRQLPAPQKHQMVAFNSELKLSDKIIFSNELAISDFDKNRFSAKDNGDNYDVGLISNLSAEEIDIGLGLLDVEVKHRQSGNNFEFFERTREIEFDRKWDLNSLDIVGENTSELSASLYIDEHSILGAELGILSLSGIDRIRQESLVSINNFGLLSLDYTQDYVSSDNRFSGTSGNWFKQKGNLRIVRSDVLQPFFYFEHEDRRERNSIGQLINNSFQFYEIGPGLGFKGNQLYIEAALILREEERIKDFEFSRESFAIEQRFKLDYSGLQRIRTENLIQVRSKSFSENFQLDGKSDENGILVNSNTNLSINETLDSRFSYRVSTQRQAIRQEAYINVGPELGQYVWIDENENGVEEIDEFFPELTPNEGTYILQFLPSDELLSAIDLKTRFVFDWNPFKKLVDHENSSWLSSLNTTSIIDIRENSLTQNEADVYLIRLNSFQNDSTTLSGLIRLEQLISLNPTSDLRLSIQGTISDQLNRRTIEIQKKSAHFLRFDSSYQISQNTRIRADVSVGENKLISNQLNNRTYNIQSISTNSGFTRRVSRSFEYGLNVGFNKKENKTENSASSSLIKLQLNSRAYIWNKIQTTFTTEFRNAKLKGSPNSYTRFELTEGTGAGRNFVWSINASYRVNNLLRLSFNYDGRTVKDRTNIHTLNMVISAVF